MKPEPDLLLAASAQTARLNIQRMDRVLVAHKYKPLSVDEIRAALQIANDLSDLVKGVHHHGR